jgi:release factor glutamine methyltransferase
MTVTEALTVARGRLAETVSSGVGLEADLLLAYALQIPRSLLRARPERALTVLEIERYFDLLARRCGGEPLAYVTGRREFWSLDLVVNKHTLIPRPESELLVTLALERAPLDAPMRMADLGTGSGAIALALASERPRCPIVATDLDPASLEVAELNARRLGLTNIEFRCGNWCAPLNGERFHIVVANPPYIAMDDFHLLKEDLPAEPRLALVAGASGLEMLTAIITEVPGHLEAHAWLLLEHSYRQGDAVAALLRERGYAAVENFRDLAGHQRVTVGRWG